jgi:hypothetical protein
MFEFASYFNAVLIKCCGIVASDISKVVKPQSKMERDFGNSSGADAIP